MADIEIVQPVEGAARVAFDYTAASDAIDAFSAMSRALYEQAYARVAPKDDTVVNWSGRFRDEFDVAWTDLQERFTGGAELAGWGRSPIDTAIASANDRQRELNEMATNPETSQPVRPTTSGLQP